MKESRDVLVKTRSTPASLSFKSQAPKHTTVKWSIAQAWVMTENRIVQYSSIIINFILKLCYA